ncbi:MAG: putative nucleoside-diphosphate-sugar epimerase [Rhodospirillaceae bacterium]|nr:MAG: putative nucleoside-diphosphate-sugar epimerase [Rhodospirillaceae bacterium]
MRGKTTLLVCGATGFIGRNCVERLAARDDLRVVAVYNRRPPFDCPGVEWVRADLSRPEDVARATRGVDVLIQAAATTSGVQDIVSRPYIHVTDNAVMNSYLLRSAFDNGVGHFIFFSCTVMYQPSDIPHDEAAFDANVPLLPQYFGVGWTKVYLEKMCEFYSRIGQTRFTVVRHSNVYGPHDKFDLEHSHVFAATVSKVMTATDTVTVWGTGTEARDLIYVGDLMDFVEAAMARQTAPFAIYCVGGGEKVTIKDLIARIIHQSGKTLSIEHDLSKPSIPTSLSLECSKAAQELGWRRATPLNEGILKTIAWWRETIDPDTLQPKHVLVLGNHET